MLVACPLPYFLLCCTFVAHSTVHLPPFPNNGFVYIQTPSSNIIREEEKEETRMETNKGGGGGEEISFPLSSTKNSPSFHSVRVFGNFPPPNLAVKRLSRVWMANFIVSHLPFLLSQISLFDEEV